MKQLWTICLLACLPIIFADGHTVVSKPNILFILLDDLGKEWINCYGAEGIETPHIDALAEGGMLFHNAYSMPQCTPSRVAFLTGQYPFRNGWVNHWDVPRWGVGYFDTKQYPSIARILQRGGYATGTPANGRSTIFASNRTCCWILDLTITVDGGGGSGKSRAF